MKKVKRAFKKQHFKKVIIYFLMWCMIVNTWLPAVLALDAGNIISSNGIDTTLTVWGDHPIIDTQHGAYINWNNFDTSDGQSVTFDQFDVLGGTLDNTSAVLNRISSGAIPTQFDGALIGNGRVFVVNPAGVIFGSTATVNVTQLVASGFDMSEAAFQNILANVANKMEFSVGTGTVTNNGAITATDSVYLVGTSVANHGSILCPNGLVVMAAGDALKLGQPGSAVIVDMATDFTVDTDNDLENSGGTGIQAKNVVLAAGDIWSQALVNTETFRAEAVGDVDIDGDILAEAVPASDAVATIDIIAGLNVNVNAALVKAEAKGSGLDSAIATTTINAGGNVTIDTGAVEARALSDDYLSLGAGDLTATVDIDAGQDLRVGSGGGHVFAIAKTGEYALGTYGDLTATVDIDAGTIRVDNGNVNAVAKTGFESYVNAGDITATVDMDAVGYSEVAGDIYVGERHETDVVGAGVSTVEAHAEAGSGISGTAGNITATVDIDAAGRLDVDEHGGIEAEAMVGYQQLAQAGNVAATISILTGSDVDVYNGYIVAAAHTDNSPAVFGDATATTHIDSGGNVEATATDNEETYIGAYAQDSDNNTASTTVLADGHVRVQEDASFTAWSVAKIEANASDGQNNDADVAVDAGGDVQVIANHGAAEIRADAEDGENNDARVEVLAGSGVEVRADSSSGITSGAVILAEAKDGFTNTAETVVDAVGDVLVMATAGSNAEAKLSAEAMNEIEISDEEESDPVPGIINDAKVDVTAAGVEVRAEDDAEAELQAEATNEIDIHNQYRIDQTVDGSLVNTAEVKIVTTGIAEPEPVDGDVLVQSFSNGEAWIGAEAGNDIRVHSESYDSVDITVDGSFENSAKVDITAADQVRVKSDGSGSESWIFTEAYNEIGNDSDQTVGLVINGNVENQAETLIDAGDDTTLEYEGINDGGDDVEVRADDGSSAYIDAEAWNYLYDLHEFGDTLNVTVNGLVENVAKADVMTGDEVWVIANYYADDDSEAGIIAWAENEIETRWWEDQTLYEGTVDFTATGSVTNQADVVINSGDNVEVQANDDGDAYIAAWANNDIFAGEVYVDVHGSINNSAGTDITTGDDVDITAEYSGEAYIEAEADNNLEDESINTLDVTVGGSVQNMAETTITADEDVELYAREGSETWIGSEATNGIEGEGVNTSVAGSLDNIATVNMQVAKNVEVEAEYDSDADIEALAQYGTNNTAGVNIVANDGHVLASTYDADVDVYAEAGDGVDNVATVNVTARDQSGEEEDDHGDVTVNAFAEREGETWIGAYTWNAENSNSGTTTINADGNVKVETDGYGRGGIESYASVDDESNTAIVDVTAGGNVEVLGRDGGESYLYTNASYGMDNTSGITIEAIGDVKVTSENGGEAVIQAKAENPYLYVGHEDVLEGLVNTAKVDISARSVEVRSENTAQAVIAAEARNEVYLGGSEYGPVAVTIRDVKNDADIIINTAPDDDGDATGAGPVADNGDVLVLDMYGGENSGGGIDTEAYNNVRNDSGYSYGVDLTIQGPVENNSDILINAGDDVMAVAIEGGDTEIDCEAWNSVGGAYGYMINLIEQGPVLNFSGVDITAGHDVGVMSSNGSWANIGAWAGNESSVLPEIFPDTKDNIATVSVNARGGVGVQADSGSESQIGAAAEFATTNTTAVAINANGPIDVRATEGSQAHIMASTRLAINSNTSGVEINAEHVEVSGNTSGEAAILADAHDTYDEENSENSAGVTIYTHAADVEPDEQSGDVLVEAVTGAGATIEAATGYAHTNTSDVLVCADGDVEIYGMTGGDADILADAMDAYSNNANIGVAARGDEGVVVRAEDEGTAFIESWAQNGNTNAAETIVCTQGGVQVIDKSTVATSAGIIAEALNGYYTDAYVGICAEEDIMVLAGIGSEDLEHGIFDGVGGHAMIRAEASSTEAEEETTATAEVAVVSRNGGVAVVDATNLELRTAEITSSANGGYINTAYTGVSAGGDLLNEENPFYEESQGVGIAVVGRGDYSNASILSETYDGHTNTSDTVVCTPAEVIVEAEGEYSIAEIGACAEKGVINTASTQVYGSEVDVTISDYYEDENGIWAWAGGLEGWPYVPYGGDFQFILTEYDGDHGYHDLVWVEEEVEGDGMAQLLIRNYGYRRDCPDYPPCPCGESPIPLGPASPLSPAAPIPERITFEILGYPALMKWVATELGVEEETIQIWFANSMASATNIQPYKTYSRFWKAAMLLKDPDGRYIDALAQVIGEFASDTPPPTEEQMASIADAIAYNITANDQYALAGAYLDALALYIDFMISEIGYSSEEAVQFVMDKYIVPLAEDGDTGVATYVAAKLAAKSPVPVGDVEPELPESPQPGSGGTILDALRSRGVL